MFLVLQPLPVPVEVVARISDTTGTLLAGNLADKNCRIGLILGKYFREPLVTEFDHLHDIKGNKSYRDI